MINYFTFLAFVIGIAIGSGISFALLWKPYEKGFDEGWKGAKSSFQNWDKGFHEGWEGATKAIAKVAAEYLDDQKCLAKNKSEDQEYEDKV